MARQNQTSEHNTFVGGLVTEASPLVFPENAAVDINNFVLSKTGQISRRLGMNFEDNHTSQYSKYVENVGSEPAISAYTWENAGGDAEARIIVVQIGYSINFYLANGFPLSGNLVHTHTLDSEYQGVYADFATVDGLLVAATGSPELLVFEYDGESVTQSEYRLKIRDVFGVAHIQNDINYRDSSNLSKRVKGNINPITEHNYNLRNSGWASLRYPRKDEFLVDPLVLFYEETGGEELDELFNGQGHLPSYSDSLLLGLLPNTEDGDNKTIDRFMPDVLLSTTTGNFPVPMGYFVIDLLDRGQDRYNQLQDLMATSTKYQGELVAGDIPTDRTDKGASTVSEFAGRVFYSGFNGDVIGGDEYSPRLSSYVLFSKLIDSKPDLSICHQVGDPTSRDNSELLDTDGGFLRIDGAYNIKRLVNIGSALIVVAENGVWAILGGSDYGFSATESKVVKVSDKGCSAPRSVVVIDNSLMYWGYDGIHHIQYNEYGDLGSNNITNNTIQTFYDDISSLNKVFCQGYYDSYEHKVRWIYGNRVTGEDDSIELVLDVALGAFYKHTIPGSSTGRPNVICPFEVPPYRAGEAVEGVVVDLDDVVSDEDSVVVTVSEPVSSTKETYYIAVTGFVLSFEDNRTNSNVEYTFCAYNDDSFLDWGDIDAEAYLITGWNGYGDYQRNKQVPYVTFHFMRTEDGFEEDELGDLYPTHQSSCKVRAMWDWSNSINSNRWGREFQAYRYKRLYMPENASDPYDTGFLTITTKNKLRGKGQVLSLNIRTEEGKDCKLLGWSMLAGIATNV